ncbi:hypothetical protein TA5114_01702 [Cognatishimia activa]|uniref:Uncharacterized protein n=2 Tax=Cognatishimia activa TaxID=1715691 RepID=A0A0P1J711_9RHOB|nr:hypothetical protein [Cognatishimia activa]CUI95516.1 hypothetical protein TA5113_01875 [Cognatishimia activa]CUK25898.1 hypothetical protein TA5114_01702 [Cognatishimia activa]
MSGNEQVMAVLLEEEDLRLVHRDWPRKMRLAVCLMPNGDCQLLLFRQEEAGLVAARLRKHLGLRPAEICIHPPVHGFPTRQLRYSDEKSLAALLADAPQLVEDATDYSVNFAFALEEGLDPVAFLGVDANEPAIDLPVAAAQDVVVEGDGVLRFSSRRAPVVPVVPKPSERKLTFDMAREAARALEIESKPLVEEKAAFESFPGEAFKPLSAFDEKETERGYTLREEHAEFVISNGEGPVVEIDNAGKLFLRDDRKLLAIRIEQEDGVQPGTVRIKSDLLPASLKSALRAACGAVEVSGEAAFLYVTLPAEQADQATPEPISAVTSHAQTNLATPTRRRAAMRLVALTTLTLAAIFLVLGMQPVDVINQSAGNGPIDWSQFRLSLQAQP